ncbi:DUF2092 domain-containing protein [Cupriavidus sp. H39]|uniref:DUF2092 domain-containing protein n=1 Tax=Cupriavidus sp. H39 TaxID=3401635 RepID=UPI003CFF28AD
MARIPVLSLIVVALSACSTTGTTSTSPEAGPQRAATAPAPVSPAESVTDAANAVDPGAVRALNDMGKYLQTLTQFEVMIELSGERVLADGQKLQHTATADLDVARPNRLRADMRSSRSQRQLIYDGTTVTLYSPQQKYYSRAAFSDNLAVLVERLRERFGVEVPSADLFLWGTSAAPLDNMQSAMSAGQDIIGGERCNHYAFRQGQIDWQIWIAAGSRPLPMKLVITNRADEARPQSVTLYKWNLKPRFGNAMFAFTPPKDATKAELIPLKSR